MIIAQTRGLSKSPQIYDSFFNYLRTLPSREGILGYWRGNLSALNRYFLTIAIKFRTYNYIRSKIFEDKTPEGTELLIKEGLTVMASMALGQLVAYPFELARTRVACDISVKEEIRTYSGGFDTLKKVAKESGIKGYYEGLLLSFSTGIAYMLISSNIYESAVESCKTQTEVAAALISAAIVAQAMIYPFEVLRRRRQVTDGSNFKPEPLNFHIQVQALLKDEGIRGFYRGFIINTVRTVPMIALHLQIYKWINNKDLFV